MSFSWEILAFSRSVFILILVSFFYDFGVASEWEKRYKIKWLHLGELGWNRSMKILESQESLLFFVGLFICSYGKADRTSRKRDRTPQISKYACRTGEGMGDFVAEKAHDHHDDLLRDDTRLLFTRESWTIHECDHPDTWLYSLDAVDRVDEKILSQKLIIWIIFSIKR